MSTLTPETGHKEAKAQAKAAKAYAKAQRPFYKKKRFVVPAALVAVIAVVAGTAGGGDDGASLVKDKSDSSVAQPAGEKGSTDKSFKIGQTVELEGTQYTVTGVKTAANIGGQFGQKADGVFVVVDVTIENKKDETKTFMDSAATFLAADGTKYEGSDAAIYLGDDSLLLREMQPDLPTKGKLVFDVPPTKVAGGVLEVADLFGGGEANIALGLK